MKNVYVDGIIYRLNPGGGITRYWTETLKALARLSAPVRCHLLLPPQATPPADAPWRARRSWRGRLAAWRADVFHTSYYTRWPRMDATSVATAYDFIDAAFPLLRPNGDGFVERQFGVVRRAAAVVAISQATRDLAAERVGLDPARIFVAYPAVSAPFVLPPPAAADVREFRRQLTGGAPYLLHVGARKNYKNFRTILQAFCRAARETDRHLVILGGRQPLAEDEIGWVVAARLLDRIHFRPRVDDATLRLAYAGADAMVHASLMEGFGIPVIEALACGTGLILSDVPVYREIADGMATFVDPADLDAWAAALRAPVPVQPTWRDEVLRRYTWEATARAHVRAYESVRT